MGKQSVVWVLAGAADRAGPLNARLRQRGLTPECLDTADGRIAGDTPIAADVAVVVLGPQMPAAQGAAVAQALRRLVAGQVPTVVWGAEKELQRAGGPLVEWVAPEAGLDEIAGKVDTLAHYVPLMKGMERELVHLHRLGEQLNRYFAEIDQEMRLAGRLQRDLLPRELPTVSVMGFGAFFRPASWISGDMYDAFRIDEHHLGMFVADAMGHGVAAGLVTMFLRQALISKRVHGDSYTIVEPAEALDALHQCLLRQKLPNSQFVTAAYGVVDAGRSALHLARAGHPYPIHIRADGSIGEVRSAGTLLGLADIPAEFEQVCVPLAPGDKVVFYSDGLEDAILVPGGPDDERAAFTAQFRRWARLRAPDFVDAVGEYLDCREGSLHPADDATLLVLDVGAPGSLPA